MASITIRNLDDETKRRLKQQRARHNRSMEEARQLLRSALELQPSRSGALASAIRRIVDPIGGAELELPARLETREPPDFSGPEYDR